MHSRRFILAQLASAPIDRTTAQAGCLADTKLFALGIKFEVLADQIDRAIEAGLDIGWEILHEFDSVESAILAMPAKTIDGLRVKARVALWALLGDFDSADQSSTDKRMMASIARDILKVT